MNRYYVMIPGNTYALDIHANNIQDAKARMRAWLGVNRLPNNTDIWLAS